MNYGAFTNDNEKDESVDILEKTHRLKEENELKETNLRLFTESLFGAFRKDKRYMCFLLFVRLLNFRIGLISINICLISDCFGPFSKT